MCEWLLHKGNQYFVLFYRCFMKVFVVVALFIISTANASSAQSPDFCRRHTLQPGEAIDGRFLGLPYEMMAFALAEKYCGAKPRPWKSLLLKAIQEKGCGPETEIYSEAEASMSRIEQASLTQLASGGDKGLNLSDQEVKDWAAQTVDIFGGCKVLMKAHGKIG